jgi:hypothetical protein
MSDEYLWDRTGPVDPEVADLEELLGRYGGQAVSEPPAPWRAGRDREAFGVRRWPASALAAAAVLALAVGIAWMGPTGPTVVREVGSWRLTALDGTPRVGSRPVDAGLVAPGAWIETDATSSAQLDVGDAGRLIIAPQSKLRITRTAPGDHRMHLDHGSIEALIWAPPGQVVLSTPGATAVDLGCAYSLTTDASGHGSLVVTAGWVGLLHDGREAFIPADASVAVYGDAGPGIPTTATASAALVAAVRAFDTASDAAGRTRAFGDILALAAPGDALTLWHLLDRVAPQERGRVHDGLAVVLDPPPGVTRAGVVAGDRVMIDAWWSALGYGDVEWWRLWRRDWHPVTEPTR